MDLAGLVRAMAGYGLDEGEATLYYHLCRLGPSRAASVAEAAGRKRTDAYRLLDRLVEKGFAEKSLERPARYVPRTPEEALEGALQVRRSQTEALETGRAALAAAWPRPVAPPGSQRQRFAVHQGRAQIDSLIQGMVAGARDEILVATSADGLARLDAEALRKLLAQKARDGVLVRVLAKRGRDGHAPLADVPGILVRYTDLPTFYQLVAADAREIACFVAAGKGISGSEESVLWLSSSDVVIAQKSLFDQAWAQAMSSDDLLHDPPRQAHVLRGRWVRTSRLKEMLRGARRSIVLEATAEEATRWARQGVLDLLRERAAAGVQVTLCTPADPGLPGILHVPTPAPRAALVAQADGEQGLLALAGRSDPDQAHDDGEWSIWSTHAEFAAVLAAALGARPGVVRPIPTRQA